MKMRVSRGSAREKAADEPPKSVAPDVPPAAGARSKHSDGLHRWDRTRTGDGLMWDSASELGQQQDAGPEGDPPRSAARLRVLIVTDNASERMGGEAVLPLEYFRRLRRRGIKAWRLAHERTRRELETLLPSELDRIT